LSVEVWEIADIYLPVDDPLVNLPDLFLNRELVRRGAGLALQ